MKIHKTNNLEIALALAKVTQQSYNALKSPRTQRVRNPFPLKTLVKLVVPTIPKGKPITTLLQTMTANQVADALQKEGFVVHPPSIKGTLSNARYNGEIFAIRGPYPIIGKRSLHYFQRG